MKLDSSISAIITGGASGLGEATARRLASHGVRVALFDRDEARGEWIGRELNGLFCKVDVTREAEVDEAFDKARAANGQERILVNCAGVGGQARTVSRDAKTGAIRPYPLEQFDRVIQANLVGTFRCIVKSAAGMLSLDALADGDRGVIINTASIAAEDGQAGHVAYAAAKAGVVGMTLPMARDLSSEAIRVNTILPGLFDTPMMRRGGEDMLDALVASAPFPKRLGQPAEFAHFVEAMITNSYINGENVRLDAAIRLAAVSDV